MAVSGVAAAGARATYADDMRSMTRQRRAPIEREGSLMKRIRQIIETILVDAEAALSALLPALRSRPAPAPARAVARRRHVHR
jgi:hypothetical protein